MISAGKRFFGSRALVFGCWILSHAGAGGRRVRPAAQCSQEPPVLRGDLAAQPSCPAMRHDAGCPGFVSIEMRRAIAEIAEVSV